MSLLPGLDGPARALRSQRRIVMADPSAMPCWIAADVAIMTGLAESDRPPAPRSEPRHHVAFSNIRKTAK